MGRLKNILYIFAFVLLCGSVGCAFFWEEVSQWGYVLVRGYSDREYIQVAADTDGSICAAYWKTPEELRLRFFDADGKHPHEWTPILPAEAEAGYLSAMYPLGNDTVFLAIYERDSSALSVYRAREGETAERLLHRDISTEGYHNTIEESESLSITARRDACRIGTFSRQQDEVCFTLIESQYTVRTGTPARNFIGVWTGTIESYACSAEGGLRKLNEQVYDPVRKKNSETVWRKEAPLMAAALPGNGLAVTRATEFTVNGKPLQADYSNSYITQMAVSRSVLYYLDNATGTVYYTDLSAMRVQEYLQVRRNSDAQVLTHLALTPSGNVLLLEDGWNLTRLRPGGIDSLSHALYPSKLQSLAVVAAFFIGAVFLAALLRYILFDRQWGNAPMALFWSFVILSCGMSLAVVLHYEVMLPDARSERSDLFDFSIWSRAAGLDALDAYLDDSGWAYYAYNVDALESMGFPDIHAVEQVVSVWSEDAQAYITWTGEPAQLVPGFCAELADRARQTQDIVRMSSRTRYTAAIAQDDITVTFIIFTDTRDPDQKVEPYVLGALAILSLTAVIALIVVGASIRYLGRGLERYSRQEPWRKLRMKTADELEGIASSLNSMAAEREEEERRRNRMVMSYRRFVPEHVLELLGRRSILEVDKNTYASREMALLMVWFTFPEPLYSASSDNRFLFENVNAVIERTAPIAARQGGTVFNYSYYGYSVVMENDPANVVSTAVVMQQEVLAFNELRAREGSPTVTFRIALDVGNVIFGVVGDSDHMQPTALSSSFSTAEELINLCNQLDAGILCTEAAASCLKQYGSRFIGKRRTKDNVLRVYEIFDGDPYDMRKGKENTLSRFSRAVMAYYSGDFAQAKHIFLELAHETPRDGCVRHYLYLADRADGSSDFLESISL